MRLHDAMDTLRFAAVVAVLVGGIGLLSAVTVGLWKQSREEVGRALWCAQACGSSRVLVCQQVTDAAWPEPRNAAGCLLDPEGHEVRFVIDQPKGE